MRNVKSIPKHEHLKKYLNDFSSANEAILNVLLFRPSHYPLGGRILRIVTFLLLGCCAAFGKKGTRKRFFPYPFFTASILLLLLCTYHVLYVRMYVCVIYVNLRKNALDFFFFFFVILNCRFRRRMGSLYLVEWQRILYQGIRNSFITGKYSIVRMRYDNFVI